MKEYLILKLKISLDQEIDPKRRKNIHLERIFSYFFEQSFCIRNFASWLLIDINLKLNLIHFK